MEAWHRSEAKFYAFPSYLYLNDAPMWVFGQVCADQTKLPPYSVRVRYLDDELVIDYRFACPYPSRCPLTVAEAEHARRHSRPLLAPWFNDFPTKNMQECALYTCNIVAYSDNAGELRGVRGEELRVGCDMPDGMLDTMEFESDEVNQIEFLLVRFHGDPNLIVYPASACLLLPDTLLETLVHNRG